MKFSVAICSTLLTGALAVIPVPTGTKGAAVSILNTQAAASTTKSPRELRRSASVPEPARRAPMTPSSGATRKDTPLAAVSWTDGDRDVQIRVYYVTPQNTLGEVSFTGFWDSGNDTKIPVAPESELLFALKLGQVLVVGYTDLRGQLSEAYYDIGIIGAKWETYVV